jgi:hypothetical protein
MSLVIPLVIAGIVAVVFISVIPRLVMHTIGELLVGRPEDFEGWCYYGRLLERGGHYLEAYNAYRRSTAINPDYIEAQMRLDNLITRMETYGASTDSLGRLDSEPQ